MARFGIESYSQFLAGNMELRAHENRSLTITMLNGQLVANSSANSRGISARSFHGGAWGFSSHPDISLASAGRVALEATNNAKSLSNYKKKQHAQLAKITPSKAVLDLQTKKTKLGAKEVIGHLQQLENYLKEKYPLVTRRTLICYQQDFIKEGMTSEGAHTFSFYARSFVIVRLGMDGELGPVEHMAVFGDKGELEDTLLPLEVMKEDLEETYKHLLNKSKGVRAEAGTKEVVLASKLAGILAHEAIGHTTEADLVLGGSVAGDGLGKMVASPLVSLVDFAHSAYGKPVPMPVYFDDEGTTAEDTWIIQDGVLKTFMNSRETAEHFGQKATGHSRAWAFNDEPLIRMRNTAIAPGKDKFEDLIASVEDGYYLMDHSNGQADSTSEFMFGVTMGYEIKKGKLGRAILDTTISGVAFDMLKSVSMVSDELTWVSYGTCGKKQPMTVGMGGPAVKCTINIGGQ